MIESSTSGQGSGGVARNAARQVSAASAGIHLTWILPFPSMLPGGLQPAGQREAQLQQPQQMTGHARTDP